MPLLRPFRDYDEKNVIGLFSFSGQTSTSQVITKGTLVGVVSDWRNDQDPNQILGSYGDFSTNNVQALRYGTIAQVGYAAGSGIYVTGALGAGVYAQPSGVAYPLGLTLFDVRELDENTIPLKYNPRKAAELEACISGQAVPIVTRGLFLISGLTGNFGGGAPLYSNGISGGITAFPTVWNSASSGSIVSGVPINFLIGHALGGTGVDGSAFIKLEL